MDASRISLNKGEYMFTYEDALNILNNGKTAKSRITRKIAPNTFLVTLGDALGVQLHDTIIVKLFANGEVRLNSGGWQTVTTKQRINRFSPFRIKQVKGLWSVWSRGEGNTFVGLYRDFMHLNHKGQVLNKAA